MVGADERYSDGLAELPRDQLPPKIWAAFEELHEAFPESRVRVLSWNEHYVAISMEVPVDLPARGPVDGVDIREVEPILLLVSRRQYPCRAPSVCSDRKTFPAEQLSHLYPAKRGSPPFLCLHRGSIDDWFAEHSVTDLVRRVRGWLRDAASNRLMREDDRFEGTRIEAPAGIIVYPSQELIQSVEETWRAVEGNPAHRYTMVTLLQNRPVRQFFGPGLSYRTHFMLPGPPTGRLLEIFNRYNQVIGEQAEEDRLLLGLLLLAPRRADHRYFGWLPSSYGELRAFCGDLEIDLEVAMRDYRAHGAQLLNGVPVIVALLRPRLLIGSSSAVELLNFVILASDEYVGADGLVQDAAPVWPLSHREPLTVRLALEVSREREEGRIGLAIIGCGAVGSKVSLHLARAGHVVQALVDPADLAPHHLVRHGLPPEAVGKNKAEALADHIRSMYRLDSGNVNVRAYPVSVYELLDRPEELSGVECLIDATASSAVLGSLISNHQLPREMRYSRCEIGHGGQLGFLLWEGAGRNPRLDDLQAALFDLGREDGAIREWLQEHRRSQEDGRADVLEEIDIGVSCSSTTLRLADDVVSYHAAVFAGYYKRRERWQNDEAGRIVVSRRPLDEPAGCLTRVVSVPQVTVLEARNASEWQVRVHQRAIARIKGWMDEVERKRLGLGFLGILGLGRRAETGGLLLGLIHRKRRTIYVTDALPASPDSRGTPYAFRRGVADYPEKIGEIAEETGKLIGYVGEWHTHPDGRVELSEPDLHAVREIRRHLQPAGLPTHIMVFGREECASFVFA